MGTFELLSHQAAPMRKQWPHNDHPDQPAGIGRVVAVGRPVREKRVCHAVTYTGAKFAQKRPPDVLCNRSPEDCIQTDLRGGLDRLCHRA